MLVVRGLCRALVSAAGLSLPKFSGLAVSAFRPSEVWTREQETAADQFGLTLAKKAGFDPSGLKAFFRTLGEKYSDREPVQWMSTHPNNKERMKAIDAYIDEL